MVVAVMQPYTFPYISYFQLINAVDKFIIYDDVNFIKSGWINRNNVLLNGKPHTFAIPLENASSNKLIYETSINSNLIDKWVKKFLLSIEQNYKKAPYYNDIYPLIEKVFSSSCLIISELALKSIQEVVNYLEVETDLVSSSSIYNNSHLKSQDRVLDICSKEGASKYINPIGGQELYSKDIFLKHGIELNFIRTEPIIYKQFKGEFVQGLSIVDVLMFNSRDNVRKFLTKYTLI